MKRKLVFVPLIVFLLQCLSCETTIIDDPVASCNFVDTLSNADHPYKDIFQAILDENVAMGMPGLSAAIETEHGWWIGCAGMACIEDQVNMKPCHLHHSASMAKPFIATLIMRLYEDGIIGIDDPIKDYLPDDMVSRIKNADVATIRQLLNHTSGIFGFDDFSGMYIDIFNDPSASFTLEDVFEKYVYGKAPYCEAGAEHHYSNTGYSLLGLIIEEASGMSLGDYFEQEIILPLGLTNTFYKSSKGYPFDLENCVNSYFCFHGKQLQNCTDLQKNLIDYAMGHEGVVATPYDFARFIKELIRGNIIDSTTLEVMLSDEIEEWENGGRYYALGIMHWEDDDGEDDGYGHNGSSAGTRTVMMSIPNAGVSIAITMNLGGHVYNAIEDRFSPLVGELINVSLTGVREDFFLRVN